MEIAKRVLPLPGYVSLKLLDPETTTAAGIELPSGTQEQSQLGKVMATGGDLPASAEALFTSCPVQVGQTVSFKKYTGHPIKSGIDEIQIVAWENLIAVVLDKEGDK